MILSPISKKKGIIYLNLPILLNNIGLNPLTFLKIGASAIKL